MTVPAHLRDRVRAIDAVDAKADATVLPSSSLVLGVQMRGRLSGASGMLAPAGITGLQESVRRYVPIGVTKSILVRFTPSGAAALGVPVGELTDRSVPLDDILPSNTVRVLVERVSAAATEREARDAIVAFLSTRSLPEDPTVDAALRALNVDDARVATVACALGISERQLERRFVARIGLTPKKWAALRRFERAVATSSSSSFTDAAIGAGYFDQAHFNRDFRRRTGTSPKQLLR